MKKAVAAISIVLALAAIAVSGICLNRSYAHIYDVIGSADLQSPDALKEYHFGGSKDPLTYVALGDSLTSGVGVGEYKESYPYLLAELMAQDGRPVALKSLGIQGARAEGVARSQAEQAVVEDPDVVTVLIGINDVHGPTSEKEFAASYERILAILTGATDARVYAVAVAPIGSDSLLAQPYRWYFDRRVRAFNGIIAELAGKYGATYVDLYAATRAAAHQDSYYSSDQFHPNAESYAQWAEIIHASIDR